MSIGGANDVGVVPKARAMCAHGPRSLRKEKKDRRWYGLRQRGGILGKENQLCALYQVSIGGRGQSSRSEEGRGRANGRIDVCICLLPGVGG